MSNSSTNLRQRLLDAQDMTPSMRDEYHKELDAILEHSLTPRTRLFLVALLLVMVAFTTVGARAMLLYYPGPLLYALWIAFTGVCAVGGLWIGRSLWRGRFPWRMVFPIADVFAVAGATITVLSLLVGLRAPSEPASTFGVLFAFALLVVSISWSLHSRIASAELSAKEQLLRIECRLADLSDRLRN